MHPDRPLLLQAALGAIDGPDPEAAHAPCRALLAADPDDPEARLLLGLAHGLSGAIAEAANLLDQVARARPDHAHPCHDLAALLAARGRSAEIAPLYRAAPLLAPGAAALRRGLARHLLAAGDPDAALAALGTADRSAAACHLAGLAEAELGRIPRAIARFRAAVARAPEDAQIRVNRAVALLHAGRWAAAWGEYEWRLRLPGHSSLPLDRLMPALAMAGDLAGRRILLTHEEGFGDTLQFARSAAPLIARGAAVTMAVPAPLRRLLAPLAPVLEPGAPLPEHDWHCPFFSLPRVFATTPATIPASVPYLRADPALAAHWAARLGPRDGRLRVGLVWAGQARPWLDGFATLDARRSARLADFAPLGAVPGLRCVSLQAGPKAAQAGAPPPGLDLEDPMAEVA